MSIFENWYSVVVVLAAAAAAACLVLVLVLEPAVMRMIMAIARNFHKLF